MYKGVGVRIAVAPLKMTSPTHCGYMLTKNNGDYDQAIPQSHTAD